MMRRPVTPVIIGPTASGKSAIGVELALECHRRGWGAGEVVSCDSIQVYRGLDIGSGKLSEADRRGVPHHLIDVADPTETFSVSRWLTMARGAIDAIRARGNIPIVVGGTHLYIMALLDGLFEAPAPDVDLRRRLREMSPEARRAELERVDPRAAGRIHPNDDRRTIRALEVHRATGRAISELQVQWDTLSPDSDEFLVACVLWETPDLSRRINARVREMMVLGLEFEARRLFEAGRLGPTAGEALGYKQLAGYFQGRCTLEEAVESIKIETRRFAKNQRTWIRRLRARPGAMLIQGGLDAQAQARAIADNMSIKLA